ncbi:MAG: phosphoribosylamine--glycine ligase [Candidatus Thermoplasmatota archaeon]
MADPAKERGESWDLYVKPKKKEEPHAPPPSPTASNDGSDLTVTPKQPRAAAPSGPIVGGAEELPGTPRPKPKPAAGAAGGEEANYRAQRPGGVEEDAEVWDAKKGWTRPSGKLVKGDEGYVKPAGEMDKSQEDEDTELIVAPKRRPEPPGAAPRGPVKSRTRDSTIVAADGTEGRDFQEYVKPLAPVEPVRPAASPTLTGLFAAPVAPKPAQQGLPAIGGLMERQGQTPTGPPVPLADAARVHVQALPQGALNILLVGSGAREHAMALAIRRSQRAHLYCVMRHRNPGLVKSATGFKLLPETDLAGIVAWAKMQKIHLAVLGPETALAAGLGDALRAIGIAVASPSQKAARIETDKTFMRTLMRKHNLPGQLGFWPFAQMGPALEFLDKHGPEFAIKPVGLTGGKGVQVFGDHFEDIEGAKQYVRSIFAQKTGGGSVQFEELARGEEFTLMAFTDGTTLLPMPAVQDHKRLFEGDQGPNTGGMGSYAQADGLLPFLSEAERDAAVAIVQSIVDALAAEGTPYVGTIYGQFMLTAAGPKIIEVNARFGDPEAMNVLHALESDYVALLEGMATGTLAARDVRFRPVATVVKYVVPRGYGEAGAEPGQAVQVDEFNVKRTRGAVFYAAVEQQMSGALTTLASRTLAVLGEGPGLAEANAVCEASLKHVHGDGLHVRHDIASPDLLARRVENMRRVRG